jgi:hypothetical protein
MHEINALLADQPEVGRVQLCECNTIHLSIGPVTINLSPEAFVQAAVLMRNAMERYAMIVTAKEIASDPLREFQPNQTTFMH